MLSPRESLKGMADNDIKTLPTAYTTDRLTMVLGKRGGREREDREGEGKREREGNKNISP